MDIRRIRGRLASGLAGVALVAAGLPAAAEPISFKEHVFPIFQIRCLECHQPGGEGYEKSGFDLRTYEGVMKGTKFGPMMIPGNAFMSNLMALIEGRAKIRMPHGKRKLSPCEKSDIRRWINQGAKNN